MNSALSPTTIKILIPCHCCGPYIEQCLHSLQNQAFSNWQALITDDASNDDTVSRIQPFMTDRRFRFISHAERRYLMQNILGGLHELAPEPNEVVAILDGDDFLLPGALEKIWQAHQQGYDLVYSDDDRGERGFSIGRQIIASVPIRQQLWSFSQLRTFKGYLLAGLEEYHLQDQNGQFFRAAGDLSLFFPLAERVGTQKIMFIPEQLYVYRIHDNCNHYVRRAEQLANNWQIRARPPLPLQTDFFDFTEEFPGLEKPMLRHLEKQIRDKYPSPYSVCIVNPIRQALVDSWRSYNNLWLGEGIFLKARITDQNE